MSIRPRQSLLNPALKRPSALQAVPRSADKIWLDKNENLDPALMQLTHQVLASIPAVALASYPEAGDLYRKLGAWVGVSPDSLLLTPGSDGAIRLTYESFVESGDAVVHTDPTFAMYPVYGQMFGAHALKVEYQPSVDGPQLDLELMRRLVREKRPKLLCLPNPDSPTGTFVSTGHLRELLDECECAGTLFLLDEAYHPFHDESAVTWTSQSRNLIVARTFAKAWGAAGLRIGYAVAHPDTVALLHKMRPMYEASTLATEFMTRMLDHSDAMQASVTRILEGREYFADAMLRQGFRVLPTAGNFLHVDFGEQGAAVHAVLKDRVLYRAFEQGCLTGFSRFSMAPKAILEPVVNLIQQATKRVP